MAPKRKQESGRTARFERRRIEKEFLVHHQPGYCFVVGTNGFGALGLGEDVLEKARAAQVDVDGKRVLAVACGGMHTVALAEDGCVYTWGVNDEGALGRPTSGTAWESEPDSNKEDSTVPGLARLPSGETAVDFPKLGWAVLRYTTAGIVDQQCDVLLLFLGKGRAGLEWLTYYCYLCLPTWQLLPADVHIVQVVAGDGFTFALSDDGAIWGWGQFKDDLSSFYSFKPGVKVQKLPSQVYQPSDVRDRVRKLAAGARHMVALTRRGEVLTWGIAGQGQLGRIQAFNNDNHPSADVLLQPSLVPGIAAAIGTDIVDIGAGSYAAFAINKRGAVAAWGLNNGGQLALPVAAEQDSEQCIWTPTAVPALSKGIAAVAGGEHHSLALTKQHQVLSFGSSNYGMLGRQDIPKPEGKETICLPDPALVDNTDGLAGDQPISITAGMHVSACVTSSGQVFLWGSNVNYQMAKGQDEFDNEVPTRMRRHKVFGNRQVLQWSFGGQHAALVASEDAAAAEDTGSVPPPTPAAKPAAAADDAGTSAAAESAGAGEVAAPAVAAEVADPSAATEAMAAGPSGGRGKRGRQAAAAPAAAAATATGAKAPATKRKKKT